AILTTSILACTAPSGAVFATNEASQVTQGALEITTDTSAPVVIGPETTPALIVTSLNVSTTIEYVELYNQSEAPIDITKIRLVAMSNDEPTCSVSLHDEGWLMGKSFVSFHSPTNMGAELFMLSGDCEFTSDITRV